MAGHVAQRARTKVPPAPPVEGKVCGVVIDLFGRPKPEVPIQFLWDAVLAGGCWQTLGPYRTVGPAVDAGDISDGPCINELLGTTHAFTRATLVAHLGHHLVFFGRFGEHAGLIDIVRKGLLDIDVLAELHGGKRGHGMGVVGRGDGHGIDILRLLVQHLPEVLIDLRLRETFDGGPDLAIVHVRKANDVGLGALREFREIAFALSAGTDARDIQRVAGGQESFAEHVPGHNGEAGGRKDRIPEELPARVLFLLR